MPTIPAPDGRRLAYREYGPAGGTPLIFIPGAGCGRLMRFGSDALLEDRGVRIISVDRPGLGASTVDPHKTLGSVAADLAHLIGVLTTEPVAVVANSQGAPFGLALARHEQVRGLFLVSPIDDLGHPPTTALLGTPHRAFVEDVAADPAAAQLQLGDFTADDLYRMVLSGYPDSDAPVYDQADFRAMFLTALRDGFASGAVGYARDTVLATCAWPAELFDQRAPVTILYGRDDDAHSPDHAVTLAARIGAHLQLLEGVGGSLLWKHPDRILDLVHPGPVPRA